jgi:osmotically-inducible protein OsmY
MQKISLSVSNGVVTLRGAVAGRQLAQRLVTRLSQIPKVREVRNHLVIAQQNKDAEIAAKLREALSRDPTTHAWGIAVSVARGVVFLSGRASSEEERTRASDLAWNVSGVRQVNNSLHVPTVSRYRVPQRIQRSVPTRTYTRTRR